MDMTEIKDKINNFLNKQAVELQEKYFIIKSLEQDYLEQVLFEDTDDDDIEEDEFEDFEPIHPVKTKLQKQSKQHIPEDDLEEDEIEDLDEDIEKEIEEELNKTKPEPKPTNNTQPHRTGIKNLIKKVIPKKPSTHEG